MQRKSIKQTTAIQILNETPKKYYHCNKSLMSQMRAIETYLGQKRHHKFLAVDLLN